MHSTIIPCSTCGNLCNNLTEAGNIFQYSTVTIAKCCKPCETEAHLTCLLCLFFFFFPENIVTLKEKVFVNSVKWDEILVLQNIFRKLFHAPQWTPWPLQPYAWVCFTSGCPTRSVHPNLCLNVNKWGSRLGRRGVWGWNVFAEKFRIRRSLKGFSFHFTVATFFNPNPPSPSYRRPPPAHKHTFFHYIS